MLKQYGKKESKEVHGVGHAETFEAVTIPELKIQIGDRNTILSPAHVILKSIGASGCVGNFGMDLFQQAPTMKIDFGAMTLQLLPVENEPARTQ